MNHWRDTMKKYVTALIIAIPALVFSGMSWADNMGKDAEDDILQGHGTVTATTGAPYVQSESRSNEQGTDLISNPQDYSSSSTSSSPAVPGTADHDDHDDQLHAIVKH